MDLIPNRDTSRPFPKFQRPMIKGAFSLDQNRSFHNGLENLKYLKIPQKINFNLNDGDDKYREKPASASDERIDHLLKFIMENQAHVISGKRLNVDFVMFRGLMRLIMCTPYENRETWIINAIKFRGTIFLCAEETIEKKNQKAKETARDKMFQRYGFKFESYILSKDPNEDPPGNKKPVNEGEEFCVMFQAELNAKNILYGAEMDGVKIKSNEPIKNIQQLQKASFVEVKVKRYEDNDRQEMNFYKFKGRNWWCQSFIVGIDKIHVGLRDDNGIVHEIKAYDLKELSNKARSSNFWHPNVCMNFLNDFLDKISSDMKHVDDFNLIYQYSYNPRNNFVNSRLLNSRTFLSDEFIQFMANL